MLFESVKILKGVIINSSLHNARMHRSRKVLFEVDVWDDIASFTEIADIPLSEKAIKARIAYDERIIKVEWEFYTRRVIKSLYSIEDNEIDYSFKYSDRTRLNELFNKRGACDDIIIVKNGLITDSSYSNLAFSDGSRWLTPSAPLLEGTKRRQLIGEGRLFEEELRLGDLKKFTKCSLINALNDIGEIEVETSCII